MVRHCVVNDLPVRLFLPATHLGDHSSHITPYFHIKVGRSVDEALRTLKAFQYFEKHGEVCPADWEEGSESINTKSPKEYFSKMNK